MPQLILSKDAINKSIMAFEVSWSESSGFAVYNRKYQRPVVPDPINTDSGVTIGIGFDCSMFSAARIKAIWGNVLPADMATSLSKVAGLKKQAAVNALSLVDNVVVPVDAALKVFYDNTLLDVGKQAVKIYQSLPNIHPVEQSVIVSLVYNRGAKLSGDRRKEMRDLVAGIANDNDRQMADSIRAMCRLWPNTLGLRLRRQKEAALIELADTPIAESDKLILDV